MLSLFLYFINISACFIERCAIFLFRIDLASSILAGSKGSGGLQFGMPFASAQPRQRLRLLISCQGLPPDVSRGSRHHSFLYYPKASNRFGLDRVVVQYGGGVLTSSAAVQHQLLRELASAPNANTRRPDRPHSNTFCWSLDDAHLVHHLDGGGGAGITRPMSPVVNNRRAAVELGTLKAIEFPRPSVRLLF